MYIVDTYVRSVFAYCLAPSKLLHHVGCFTLFWLHSIFRCLPISIFECLVPGPVPLALSPLAVFFWPLVIDRWSLALHPLALEPLVLVPPPLAVGPWPLALGPWPLAVGPKTLALGPLFV